MRMAKIFGVVLVMLFFPIVSLAAPTNEAECRAEGGDCFVSCGGKEELGICEAQLGGRTDKKCCEIEDDSGGSDEPITTRSACLNAPGSTVCIPNCQGEFGEEIGLCEAQRGGQTDQKCCRWTGSGSPPPVSANAALDYTPLEPIPGFESTDTSTLEGFLRGLYLFVMWTVGIAAMFMIMIGGFWYLTSAGNTSRTGEAKKIITNALIGLLVALVTWLLLYVINPDFVNVDLRSLEAIHISSEEGLQYPDDPNAPPAPPGSDTPRPPGPVGGQCAGMDMQAAIYSSQCNDAAPAVLALISCIEEQVPDAQISSISDDQGFTYCQYHWSRPPCAHTDNSCHYGGAAKEPKSCAVDISTRGVGAIALVNAGRSCGAAKVINEGNHVHFSVYGCKCDQHS